MIFDNMEWKVRKKHEENRFSSRFGPYDDGNDGLWKQQK